MTKEQHCRAIQMCNCSVNGQGQGIRNGTGHLENCPSHKYLQRFIFKTKKKDPNALR